MSAMIHYKDGEFAASVDDFESALSVRDGVQDDDYFYAAAAALRAGQFENVLKYIRSAVTLKNTAREYFEWFDEFDGYRDLAVMIQLDMEYDSLQQVYLSGLDDPGVYWEVKELVERDQFVRRGDASFAEIARVDSLNISSLIKITEQYGWQEDAWLLLWHHRGTFKMDNYVWSYFSPLINRLIEDCVIHPSYWARYEDFYQMLNHNEQLYGTMWGNYHNYPIRDLSRVDELRDSMGLPPLWYMQKVYGASLPDGYEGGQ